MDILLYINMSPNLLNKFGFAGYTNYALQVLSRLVVMNEIFTYPCSLEYSSLLKVSLVVSVNICGGAFIIKIDTRLVITNRCKTEIKNIVQCVSFILKLTIDSFIVVLPMNILHTHHI